MIYLKLCLIIFVKFNFSNKELFVIEYFIIDIMFSLVDFYVSGILVYLYFIVS